MSIKELIQKTLSNYRDPEEQRAHETRQWGRWRQLKALGITEADVHSFDQVDGSLVMTNGLRVPF